MISKQLLRKIVFNIPILRKYYFKKRISGGELISCENLYSFLDEAEAFTISVVNVTKQLDIGKNNILKVLNCSVLSYYDAAKWRNEKDLTKDSLEVFRSFYEEASKDTSSLNHRYLTEDVPMGLVMMESLGKQLNIETGALLGKDFRNNGNVISDIMI